MAGRWRTRVDDGKQDGREDRLDMGVPLGV
jgi:hypothetical protein